MQIRPAPAERSLPTTNGCALECGVGFRQLRTNLQFAFLTPPPIFAPMLKSPFDPCIPTRGTKVPDRPNWLHEIKHDGYRLIVQRDGKRVRLWTRNGHDWSDRFPLITEAALRNRNSSFVIDGEAVLLGVDGRSRLQRPALAQAR